MKVAIAGYGAEGEANYNYWLALGADITIFDEADTPTHQLPEGAATRLGRGVLTDMNGFDLVIRTAGLNPNHIKTDGKIWSATNEFFAKCPAPIIGVTGTKGKGTTCSLITEILKEAGKTVHLVGNIGTPALEVLPTVKADDFVVFELSSFQLWDIEKSPETAVVLMIEPDHLNVHADMGEYIEAKANIGKFQTADDLMVYHPKNERSARAASPSPAQKKRYMTPDGAQIMETKIVIEDNIICDISEVGLLGVHNLENICAAITAAWRYTQNVTSIMKAVTTFKGLPHRLELVRELHGVKYINDSFSTGPAATLAALKSFSEPLLVIIGGSDKGIDQTQLINFLDNDLHSVILIGSSSDRLEGVLRTRGFTHITNLGQCQTMREVVSKIPALIHDERVVLLSPAHASFDMFASVYDRGDQYRQAVMELA